MHKTKGMTLVEALLVLTLTGLVAALSINIVRPKSNYNLLYSSAYRFLRKSVGETLVATSSGVLGADLCTSLKSNLNIIDDTSLSCATSSTASPFSTPNFILANTMRVYGFTTANDTSTYPKSVYIDIDGSNGSGVVDSDVFKFVINADGSVLPGSSEGESLLTCNVMLEGYLSSNKAAVKTAIMNQTGWSDATTEAFLSSPMPASILKGVNYTKAAALKTAVETANGSNGGVTIRFLGD